MSARAEVSKRNPYYISKHRYYELKHFCLQYPEWKEQVRDAVRYSKNGRNVGTNSEWSDPTYDSVYICQEANNKIRLVEECAYLASNEIGDYILKAVTQGLSFTNLKMMLNVPCGKDMYYEKYRLFFYILDSRKTQPL